MLQGILGGLGQKLQGDEGSARLYGLGLLASQMAAGQTPNAGPAMQMLADRRSQRELQSQMQGGEFMNQFSPQEQAFLATLPPQAAQQLIAQRIFAQPAAPVIGTEINGQLVNPQTGELMGDFRTPDTPEAGFTTLTPEEVSAIPGLNPALTYQRGPDGKILQVDGSGMSTEYIVTGDAASNMGLDPSKSYNISSGPEGIRASEIGGGVVTLNMGADGVDYGDPGDGLVWQRDGQGNIVMDARGAPVAIPYQGGSVFRTEEQLEAERIAEETQAALEASKSGELAARAGSVVIEDIERFKEIVINAPWYSPATGFGSGYLETVRGTNAANAAALATTIKGNIGFDRLQQMREASPTGGALGSVSQQELDTLQSVLGSLSQSQGEAQLLENLERLEVIYTDIMAKFAAYPNAADFGFGAQGPEISDEDLLSLYGTNR